MKAVFLQRPGGAEAVVTAETNVPQPQPGELLVRVHAAGLIRTELRWFTTLQARNGESRPFPVSLGHEFSGVVAALGPGVTGVAVGEAVIGLNDWFGPGAMAEFAIARAAEVAPKPRSLAHAAAAAVPMAALTAWQGLFTHGGLVAGQRVLIHGAAGGVGSFAVQFAALYGLEVLATAAPYNLAFVRHLGADQVINYHTTAFEQVVRDMDLVFDTVGGDLLTRSQQVLKADGKLLSIVSGPNGESSAGHRFFIVEANRRQLIQIGQLIDSGQVQVTVDRIFPLAQAREAYERRPVRGRIVLCVVQ